MGRLSTFVRNGAMYVCAPFSRIGVPTPLRRVISLHDIPETHRSAFSEKMRWVREWAQMVSLADLFDEQNLAPDRVNIALTFDDGFGEYAGAVATTLRELSIPATFFVPSGAIGLADGAAKHFARERLKRRNGTFTFMNKDEVRSLAHDPLFSIGGHSMHHADLSTLSSERLDEEIAGDKIALETLIGTPVRFFAYSFGGLANVSVESMRAVERAGYDAAFTIVPSFWKHATPRFLVGRDSLSVTDSTSLWRAWLSGGYDVLSYLKNRSRLHHILSPSM